MFFKRSGCDYVLAQPWIQIILLVPLRQISVWTVVRVLVLTIRLEYKYGYTHLHYNILFFSNNEDQLISKLSCRIYLMMIMTMLNAMGAAVQP